MPHEEAPWAWNGSRLVRLWFHASVAPGGTRWRSPASRWPWPLLWRGFCRVLPTHFLSPSGPHHAFRSPTLTFSVSLPSRSFFLTPVLLTCRPAHTRLSCDTTHLTRGPLCSPPRLPLRPPPRGLILEPPPPRALCALHGWQLWGYANTRLYKCPRKYVRVSEEWKPYEGRRSSIFSTLSPMLTRCPCDEFVFWSP